MAELKAYEVSCSYTVVETKPLSPFAWVLLRATKLFPLGARPSFDEFASKLNVGERSFIDAAWDECLMQSLVSPMTTNFQEVELNERGHLAFSRGYVTVGSPRRREGETLYFRLRDGEVIRLQDHFKFLERRPHPKPNWSENITGAAVAQAVNAQSSSELRHITDQMRVEFVEINWPASQQVVISTDRSG